MVLIGNNYFKLFQQSFTWQEMTSFACRTESDPFDWINAGGGYSLKEIGDYFDLHDSTVSGIIRDHKSKT